MANHLKQKEMREHVGLLIKGRSDANRISELLKDEGIDTFISSPYQRAIRTIEELAQYPIYTGWNSTKKIY